jgi:hypothetical protein
VDAGVARDLEFLASAEKDFRLQPELSLYAFIYKSLFDPERLEVTLSFWPKNR